MGGVGVKSYRPHLLVLGVLVIMLLTGMHDALRHALTDYRFNWTPRSASGDVVLVEMDPRSLEKIGVWPWPRQLHAELIGKLMSAGAREILFDIDFSSPTTPEADTVLTDSLRKADGSIVLATFKQSVKDRGDGQTIHVNRPIPQLAQHAWSAIVNVPADEDGVVRRYLYADVLDGNVLPSIGALLAGRPEVKQGSFLIDFGIRATSVPTVSYVDVLNGDPATLRTINDKKVIIGGTAIELGDRFNVPNGRIIAGPLLQALAAESIIQGRALRTTGPLLTVLGLGILILLMFAVWRSLSAPWRAGALVGLAMAIEGGSLLLQAQQPVVVDTTWYHVAIVAYLVAVALDEIDFRRFLGVIAERRFQQIAMSLGDGLVCTDRNGLITVWNPGAAAIFGYEPKEILGRPFDMICSAGTEAATSGAFRITDLSSETLQVAGGKVIELEGRRKSDEIFPLEACISGWQGTDGFQYGAVMRDISVRKREAERIRYLAEYDTLTGLANRHLLYQHLGKKLDVAKQQAAKVALLLMDLDKFKEINDTLGHACGDQVLCTIAETLRTLVGDSYLVARLSGDEFAIVIADSDVAERARELSERIVLAFSETPLTFNAQQIRVRGSIGVAIYPDDCGTMEELLGNADLALYQAKAGGRGRYAFFDREIRRALEARRALEEDLKRAAECDEFELFYQPQIDLISRKLVGVEALIRWRHPVRGLVSPAEFIPVINASVMSDGVARWVLETACRQGRAWQQQGHDVRIAVNLAPSQLQSGDLADTVASVLGDTQLSPSLLELEVTEVILLEDDDRARSIFRRIQDLGVQIAFDDFGTGYASLSYLKKFPLDVLKIDQTFVRGLRLDSEDAAIVSATINLGKRLGLSIIAEGIEDPDTADLLVTMGCEIGQGYHFGRPLPAAEFEKKFLTKDAPATSNSSVRRAATAA